MASTRPKSKRWRTATVSFAILATVTGDSGALDAAPPTTRRAVHAQVPAGATDATPASQGLDSRNAVLTEYDHLYAQIAADPRVRLDMDHDIWATWDEVLTPDSPLREFFIVSAFDPGSPRNYRQLAGATLPAQLRSGERNAELPMVHELLDPLPDDRSEVTVRTCIHHDFRIFDEQDRSIEVSLDAQVQGSVTFRRVAGEWRVHEYGRNWNRVCERCGPEPPGTAHLTTYIEAGTGERRPRRAAPPCRPTEPSPASLPLRE